LTTTRVGFSIINTFINMNKCRAERCDLEEDSSMEQRREPGRRPSAAAAGAERRP
jgi:hypothetical protein